MTNDRKNIATNRTKIAAQYGVGDAVFSSWIEVNPELKKLLQPYIDAKKRTLPPDVVKRVFEILGES